ncbi:tryptophan halogenase family protein [Congregibacter sp.]|uniref:tryptophan halogenase family protein n=1 Tax=Congregibacter sp. TaxID=2744308 RepID=UPI003F6D8DFA
MNLTKQIVVVGGGTAGWLAAARLAAAGFDDVVVTVVESPDVPSVGVGEGTWPTMRSTLQSIGLSEREVLCNCDASFKQGTLFRGWRDGSPEDSYLHPFSLPPEYSTTNFAEYWRAGVLTGSYSDAVTPQSAIAASGQAPKTVETPDYAFAVNYGYHFDAVKFAALLREHCVNKLGVVHVQDHVHAVSLDEHDFIDSVALKEAGILEGDLFIDCTGSRALLLGERLGVGFSSVRHVLPNNRAVVTQVPYTTPEEEIFSCTQSSARSAGWIWDIGLQSRRGVGYVHDADSVSEDEAIATLRSYAAESAGEEAAGGLQTRTLNFEPGYRATPWKNNCIAIGLSAGFIEPLEASALAMIEQAISYLVDNFPVNRSLMAPASRGFNKKMQEHWASIQEFLKLHYVLSRRDDSEYWRRARDPDGTPAALLDKLALWQIRAPWHIDSPRLDALFPAASYQYVWLGMQAHRHSFKTRSAGSLSSDASKFLDRTLFEVREKSLKLKQAMPGNRALLKALTADMENREAATL